MVPSSSLSAAAIVLKPIGRPFADISSSSNRISSSSNPIAFMPSWSSPYWVVFKFTSDSLATSAKSRTLLSSRKASLGVPLLLFAISCAESGCVTFSSLIEAKRTISANSSDE